MMSLKQNPMMFLENLLFLFEYENGKLRRLRYK